MGFQVVFLYSQGFLCLQGSSFFYMCALPYADSNGLSEFLISSYVIPSLRPFANTSRNSFIPFFLVFTTALQHGQTTPLHLQPLRFIAHWALHFTLHTLYSLRPLSHSLSFPSPASFLAPRRHLGVIFDPLNDATRSLLPVSRTLTASPASLFWDNFILNIYIKKLRRVCPRSDANDAVDPFLPKRDYNPASFSVQK